GANFLLASLQGADLGGAKLQLADFSSAALQGATLSLASLQGAKLRDAELEGANLQLALLHGVDMAGSKLQGSDLAAAVVWRAEPPAVEGAGLSDSAQIVLRPPNEEELRGLIAALTRIESGPLKARLTDAIGVLANPAQNAAWANSSEQQLWQGLAKSSEVASDGYKARLTELLSRPICPSP